MSEIESKGNKKRKGARGKEGLYLYLSLQLHLLSFFFSVPRWWVSAERPNPQRTKTAPFLKARRRWRRSLLRRENPSPLTRPGPNGPNATPPRSTRRTQLQAQPSESQHFRPFFVCSMRVAKFLSGCIGAGETTTFWRPSVTTVKLGWMGFCTILMTMLTLWYSSFAFI